MTFRPVRKSDGHMDFVVDPDERWVEDNCISRRDLIQFMKANINVVAAQVPEDHVGQVWCVDGFTRAADSILTFLTERKKKRGLKTQEEAENGRKEREKRES